MLSKHGMHRGYEGLKELARLLREAGAEVQVRWQRTGHGPAPEAVEGAKRWLSQAVRGATAGMG